jgi:hypothetical protein
VRLEELSGLEFDVFSSIFSRLEHMIRRNLNDFRKEMVYSYYVKEVEVYIDKKRNIDIEIIFRADADPARFNLRHGLSGMWDTSSCVIARPQELLYGFSIDDVDVYDLIEWTNSRDERTIVVVKDHISWEMDLIRKDVVKKLIACYRDDYKTIGPQPKKLRLGKVRKLRLGGGK